MCAVSIWKWFTLIDLQHLSSLCNVGGATDHHNRPITIAEVVPDGPAFRYIICHRPFYCRLINYCTPLGVQFKRPGVLPLLVPTFSELYQIKDLLQ